MLGFAVGYTNFYLSSHSIKGLFIRFVKFNGLEDRFNRYCNNFEFYDKQIRSIGISVLKIENNRVVSLIKLGETNRIRKKGEAIFVI